MPVHWCWKGPLSSLSRWKCFSLPHARVSLYWPLNPTLLSWQGTSGILVGGWVSPLSLNSILAQLPLGPKNLVYPRSEGGAVRVSSPEKPCAWAVLLTGLETARLSVHVLMRPQTYVLLHSPWVSRRFTPNLRTAGGAPPCPAPQPH